MRPIAKSSNFNLMSKRIHTQVTLTHFLDTDALDLHANIPVYARANTCPLEHSFAWVRNSAFLHYAVI